MQSTQSLRQKASELDNKRSPEIKKYAKNFHKPENYFGNNSLGLLPKGFKKKLKLHYRIWKEEQHNGHFYTDGTKDFRPWWKKQEQLCKTASKLLGCKYKLPCPEVAIGNGGLSVNTRLTLEIFMQYIRDKKMKKGSTPTFITIGTNFPSDDVGFKACLKIVFGKNYKLIEFKPKDEDGLYDFNELIKTIKSTPNLQLGFFPGLCYTTGQRFPIEKITKALHEVRALAGFDLAHSVGNYQLQLHDWGADFATFCGYKYLNGGPGSISGFFVHEKWFSNKKFDNTVSGWFGIHEEDRFSYDPKNFRPAPGAWSMLLCNDMVYSMLALEASFENIEECGHSKIYANNKKLSTFLYECLKSIPELRIITPEPWKERGCQISFKSSADVDALLAYIKDKKFCEKRGENIIRVTPVSCNSFKNVYKLAKHIGNYFPSSNTLLDIVK